MTTPVFPARPELGTAAPWSFPAVHQQPIGDHLSAMAVRLPGQHVITVHVAVPYPVTAESLPQAGLTALMAHSMDEGTVSRTAEQFAAISERCGAACSVGYGEYGFVATLDVPARRFADALPLLRETVVEPGFRSDDVIRVRDTSLADLAHRRARADYRASIEFSALYYPAGHRFSVGRNGTADTLASFTPETVRGHYGRVVTPRGGALICAGDLPVTTMVDELTDVFADWAPTLQPTSLPDVTPVLRNPAGVRHVRIVDRPDSVQAEMFMGVPGPCRTAVPTWAPFHMLSFLLGGWPGARLDAVLREDKGYTYSMSCGFQSRVGHGTFVVAGAMKPETIGEALRIALDVTASARDGFTEDEVAAARDYLSFTAPNRYAQAEAVASEVATRHLQGGSVADTEELLRRFRTVTAEELVEAYRAWVDDSWTIVVVGDAQVIEPQITAALPQFTVSVDAGETA